MQQSLCRIACDQKAHMYSKMVIPWNWDLGFDCITLVGSSPPADSQSAGRPPLRPLQRTRISLPGGAEASNTSNFMKLSTLQESLLHTAAAFGRRYRASAAMPPTSLAVSRKDALASSHVKSQMPALGLTANASVANVSAPRVTKNRFPPTAWSNGWFFSFRVRVFCGLTLSIR